MVSRMHRDGNHIIVSEVPEGTALYELADALTNGITVDAERDSLTILYGLNDEVSYILNDDALAFQTKRKEESHR